MLAARSCLSKSHYRRVTFTKTRGVTPCTSAGRASVAMKFLPFMFKAKLKTSNRELINKNAPGRAKQATEDACALHKSARSSRSPVQQKWTDLTYVQREGRVQAQTSVKPKHGRPDPDLDREAGRLWTDKRQAHTQRISALQDRFLRGSYTSQPYSHPSRPPEVPCHSLSQA